MGELVALAAWVLAFFAALEFGAEVGQSVFAGIADPAMAGAGRLCRAFVGVLVVMALVRLAVHIAD